MGRRLLLLALVVTCFFRTRLRSPPATMPVRWHCPCPQITVQGMRPHLSCIENLHIHNTLCDLRDVEHELILYGRLSINRASENALKRLPGIGPRLARRIIRYRKTHGPFRRIGELRQVKGIGPRIIGRLKSLLRL